MLASVMPAAFEDVGEALQIGIDVGVRLLERVTHPGLRREMHNLRKSIRLEECSRSGAVGDIDPLEAESLFILECLDPRLFKSGIVVWRHVVDADHATSRREQSPSHMRADESGG